MGRWHGTKRTLPLLLSCAPLLLLSCAIPQATGPSFRRADDAQPLRGHYRAALAAIDTGDVERAKRELKLSIQDDPLHGPSHFLLASLLAREGEIEQAIVGYQRTASLDSSDAAARYNLGTSLLWKGEPVAAARELEEANAIRPDHVPTCNNLAKAYYVIGVPELAVAGYREALRLDPTNEVALKNLAVLGAAASDGGAPGVRGDQPAKGGAIAPGTAEQPAAPAGWQQEPIAPEAPAMPDAEGKALEQAAASLHELLRDLPHVTLEQRGGRLVVSGWTSNATERSLLDRVLAKGTDVLDLTTGDAGDSYRLLEIDAIMFHVSGIDSESVGHNFLRNVQVAAQYFAGDPAPVTTWLFSAGINYQVNIANATEQRIAFLARPHLTTLSGTPAKFLAGGDIVFKVSGTTSGDIKPYPFGTSLEVTPTLLRTVGADGSPLVRLSVKMGRRSILPLDALESRLSSDGTMAFSNLEVTSEAVLRLGQTLILTGLSQRESNQANSGVPGLKRVPIVKYFFSSDASTTSDVSVIMLLTPRDPASWDEQNKKALAEFIELRRGYVEAARGTEEDRRRFKEAHPDWDKLAPNRFASHFFLMENSDVYRAVSDMDLYTESLDFQLLGKSSKGKGR